MIPVKYYEKKQQEKGFYTSMAYIYSEPVIHTEKTERDRHFEIKINKAGTLSTKKDNLYSFLFSEKSEYSYKLSKILRENENEDYYDGFVLLVKDSKTGEDTVWTLITNSSNNNVKKYNKSATIKIKDAYKASPDVNFDKIAEILKRTKCFYLYVEKKD